jgi:glycosyltransferase involved in cell wall biosynthesis
LVHLANYANPHPGSFIALLAAIFKEAEKRGWQVDACFPPGVEDVEWPGTLEAAGAHVRVIPTGSTSKRARWIRDLLAESDQPTVVHTHFTRFDVAAARAARGRPATPLFWHVHTVLGPSPWIWMRNAVKFGTFGRGVSGVLVPAEDVGDGLARRFAPRERIILVPSPIDVSVYAPPSASERALARERLGISDGSAALLHIGRAWELKGGDIYLQAVRRLVDEGVDLTAITLRGGEPAELEAERLGLGDRVRVIPQVEEMRELYAAADCFVAPSRGEGMPFSLVEALASGIPVVASDHLSGHRFLSDQLAACATVPGEPKEIAAGVRRMLERPAGQARDDAARARDWIAANLSIEVAARRMLELYSEALEGEAPRG